MFPVDSELVLASQGTSRVLTPSSCKSPPVGNHAASVLWAPVSSTKSPLTRVFQLPPPLFFPLEILPMDWDLALPSSVPLMIDTEGWNCPA